MPFCFLNFIFKCKFFTSEKLSSILLKSQKKIVKTFPTADHCVLRVERFSSAGRIQLVGCSFHPYTVSYT